MKTFYVGGHRLFNCFDNLEAAVECAECGDVIELKKDVHDVSVTITKEITINGNGHTITPLKKKAALNGLSFVTLNNIQFNCGPCTNAIFVRKGAELNNIVTNIEGPVSTMYPTIVQRGGTLLIKDSRITFMETYRAHGTNPETKTIMKGCILWGCYDEASGLSIDTDKLSKFRGITDLFESRIECACFEGNAKLFKVMLWNFNRITGSAKLDSCGFVTSADRVPKESINLTPYCLWIKGGTVEITKYSCTLATNCLGFYMTSGTLDIHSSIGKHKSAFHRIKGGSISFTNVIDNGFYRITDAHCRIVCSTVNSSLESKSAMDKLDAMVGLTSVKKQLRTILNTICINTKYPEKNFGFSNHMVFAGDPGTGKTTVAKLVARTLYEIGAIPEDKCMEVPASQLVKGFVGQTAEHVESVMKEALGGVLFIDEAYELAVKDSQNTFNNDVLGVLIRYMEDYRDSLVVIAAGYEKEMKEFLSSNVGLIRRFQWISFEDYTPSEMVAIFRSMMDSVNEEYAFENGDWLLKDCFEQLTTYYLMHPDAKGRTTNGGNGGLVRNLFQQIIFARNNRIMNDPKSTMEITYADIMAGYQEEVEKTKNVL